MDETRRMLELTGDRFEMPEPAMDRMLGRRERKQRNERIAAAVVGLGVGATGIVGAVLTLRVTGGTRPASGGGEAAANEGGGFLLPTIAIWTAIVVLGLAVLATMRLRTRFAHVDVDDVEGREPGGGAASARSSATASGEAPSEGGSQMDSRSKADVVGLPRTKMPEIRIDDRKLRRTNRWLAGAVVVLALVVVALGAALIASSGEEPVRETPVSPPPTVGLADAATVAMVDAILKADSGRAFASFFTKDGVMNEVNIGLVTTGRAAIARHQQEYLDEGIWGERVGPVIQSGSYVAWAADYPGLSLIFVCELAKPTPAEPTPNGQISHMWGIAD